MYCAHVHLSSIIIFLYCPQTEAMGSSQIQALQQQQQQQAQQQQQHQLQQLQQQQQQLKAIQQQAIGLMGVQGLIGGLGAGALTGGQGLLGAAAGLQPLMGRQNKFSGGSKIYFCSDIHNK